MRHLIYFMGYAMVKRLKNAALELRMLQVVMYDVCRVVAKFFFIDNHGPDTFSKNFYSEFAICCTLI